MSGTAPQILFVNASGHYAGAEAMLVGLTQGLLEHGWNPLVILPFAGELSAALTAVGVAWEVRALGVLGTRRDLRAPHVLVRRMARIPWAARELAELIRRRGIRLVHTNSSALVDGALAARWAGVPHVWHVRELLDGPRLMWGVLRRTIPALATRVLCVSRAVAAHLGAPCARTQIMPDGVAVARYARPVARAGAWDERGPVIGMLARINGRKGHDDFVQAAARVAQQFPRARFVLAGGALPVYAEQAQALRAAIAVLGLTERIVVEGALAPEAVPAFMAGLDVFVLPSRVVEGFGLVALEAMAAGLPVVATGGGPEDLVVPGETGLIVPRADPVGLAVAVAGLLAEPERARAMGMRGQARARDRFSLSQHVTRVEQVYRELIETR